jgi:polar amino acid transport system substrate-binding protein
MAEAGRSGSRIVPGSAARRAPPMGEIRMLRSILGLFASLALVVAAGTASLAAGDDAASPVLSRIVKSGELRVGMSGSQPPLNVKSRSGELIGLEVDLATLLADAMGAEAKLVTKPFAELLGALAKGEVDLVMSGMTITPQRNLQAAFVGPYFVSGKSILTKSETLAKVDEATDIDDPSVSLAALESSTSQRFVELLVPKAKLVTVKDYDEGVKLVLDDKADALVADYPICLLSVLRHSDKGLATLVAPLTIEPIGIAMPANDPLLVNLLQNYLNALEGTGVLEALRARWFEDGSWLDQLP